ncbi:MAG TPA: glycosyltransferase [Acetobacteraceae bacterium]|nr:glycosyltransferase [Acetobacteraceae bacterium]
MRILYSHRIQSRDGQSVHVEELVTALRGLGHEVLVVGPGLYEQARFGGESRLVAWIRARLPAAIGELAELAYNVPAWWRLRTAYRQFRPDLIYERYNLYYLAGAWVARGYCTPFFLEVNAPLADERARFGGLGLPWLAHALERHVWRSATRVLVVTGVLRDMIAAAGVSATRISVVPNGIDPARFAALPQRAPTAEPVVLGFVGFVRAWHGLDTVIAAMAEDHDGPPLRLVVVGDGPVRAELEQQAAALGLRERVAFTGLQPHEAIPALVAEFDIALQPLVVSYASPLKLFEYMAAARAIVAPDQPNIREVLRDGETAVLFLPTEPGAMWRAIRRLAGDAALRQRLGAAARAEIARRDYTWAGNAARVAAWASEYDRAVPTKQQSDMDNLQQQVVAKKAEFDRLRDQAPRGLTNLEHVHDLELTYTSNAIEGNTLTAAETTLVVEHGITIGGKPLKDHLEAIDHYEAIHYVRDQARRSTPLTEGDLRNLHSLVVKRSDPDIAGRYADQGRYALTDGGRHSFPSPAEVPALMGDFARWLGTAADTPETAFTAHRRLVDIHPYNDGNGRTARLLMNLILLRGGYPPVAVRPEDRLAYLTALQQEQAGQGNAAFNRLLCQRLNETLDTYLSAARESLTSPTQSQE